MATTRSVRGRLRISTPGRQRCDVVDVAEEERRAALLENLLDRRAPAATHFEETGPAVVVHAVELDGRNLLVWNGAPPYQGVFVLPPIRPAVTEEAPPAEDRLELVRGRPMRRIEPRGAHEYTRGDEAGMGGRGTVGQHAAAHARVEPVCADTMSASSADPSSNQPTPVRPAGRWRAQPDPPMPPPTMAIPADGTIAPPGRGAVWHDMIKAYDD
jgi:hypothetical protein